MRMPDKPRILRGMHFNGLDLNLLVALDVLLTERNITLASRRLHLSQSAASGALARLRDYFGDELLTQVGRRMVLTPLGESLAAPVRDILLRVETTVQTRPQFDPASARHHFKLLMSDYVATVLMTRAIGWLGRSLSKQTLELRRCGFPTWIDLQYGPVLSVVSVKYDDADGNEQTLDPSLYVVHGSIIARAPGAAWPAVRQGGESVRVRYEAGQARTLPDMAERQADQMRGIVASRATSTGSGIAQDGAMRTMAGEVL